MIQARQINVCWWVDEVATIMSCACLQLFAQFLPTDVANELPLPN